jgi:hypothetical protein
MPFAGIWPLACPPAGPDTRLGIPVSMKGHTPFYVVVRRLISKSETPEVPGRRLSMPTKGKPILMPLRSTSKHKSDD